MKFKSFLYIFTYLGAVFLMSHIISNNVSAVSPVIDLSAYDTVYINEEPAFNCNYSDGTWVRGTRSCSLDNTHRIMRTISTAITFPHKSGDIVNFDLVIYQQNIDSLTQGLVFRTYYPGNNNVLLSFEKLSDTSMQHDVLSQYAPTGYIVSDVFNVTYSSINEADKAMGFATGTGNFIQYEPNQFQEDLGTITTGLIVRIQNLKVYRLNGSKINNEQAQATQDAADASETAGSDASSDAEGATSSLLSVIGGFANIITNASPSNCVIDAPLNTYFSNDRFHVDLCALDLPSGIGVLTSIIAIMLVVPFCISMFNKFIGIISGFQR